jgi:hypothetical protein
MEQLDKADNMLNSGSYGDFDQLIGDLNDPRLAALREKRDGAEEVCLSPATAFIHSHVPYGLGSRGVAGNRPGIAISRSKTRSLRPR